MNTAANTVKVWDLFVRIFHWSLVLAFTVAYFTAEESEELHEISGYIVLALISVRVLWGFVGSRYARFSDFVYSPSVVIAYAKSHFGGHPKRYLGHNPLGGYMVLAILVMLFAVSVTGLKLESVEEVEAEEEYWEEIHESVTDITLALIVLHIAGVVISGRLHKENLARAMVTGMKTDETDSNPK